MSSSGASTKLSIRVSDDFDLSAGTLVNANGRLVAKPPKEPTGFQLIERLRRFERRPDIERAVPGSAEEALGLTLACLRFGSYLGVLVDPAKRPWERAGDPTTSAFTDDEMRRINVEASANLAMWLWLAVRFEHAPEAYGYEKGLGGLVAAYPRSGELVNRLVSGEGQNPDLFSFVDWEATMRHLDVKDPRHGHHRTAAQRAVANTLINVAWRNGGPVENLHAGVVRDAPLDRRRLTEAEEEAVLVRTAALLASGLRVFHRLRSVRQGRCIQDAAVVFGAIPLLSPAGWTVSETSAEVVYPW